MSDQRNRMVSVALFGREVFTIRAQKTSCVRSDETAAKDAQTPAVRRSLQPKDLLPQFLVSSLLLHQSFQLLTETPEEGLHAVTGMVVGRVRILEQVVPLALSHQSVAGATAANDSLASEFIRLHGFGALPLAYFHSHPGSGLRATEPSGTDRRTQASMEKSGSRVVGGIFSRDGFVRFFANGWEPRVRVLGKRVQEVERNVYQLVLEEDMAA